MSIKTRNIFIWSMLVIIILLAAFLRFYRVGDIPPAISWDEAAVGYNGYTIANWGRDEWGKSFPLIFRSFEDDKNPIHVYFTAISVKIFGLSEFSTRLPAGLFGLLNVVIIFLLARKLFVSDLAGIMAAFLLAVSPYAIQFSRFNHELNFALFFFMFGLYFFLKGINDNPKLLPISTVSFEISIISYHSSKIVVPPILLLLFILYHKNILKVKRYFFISVICLGIILSVFIMEPALIGQSRVQQTLLSKKDVEQTTLYQMTQNQFLGSIEKMSKNYIAHFSVDYLFISGDRIPRHSTGIIGEFYKIEIISLIIGLAALIRLRSKISLILIVWALLGPLPVAPSGGAEGGGHAGRAMFMMGSWNLISTYGFYFLYSFVKNKNLKIVFMVGIFLLIGFQFKDYLYDYYNKYSIREANEWQYGMKQIVEFVHTHDGYSRVFMTDVKSQPYIFFLYFLKTPLPDFLKTVRYNDSSTRPSNLVASFEKYQFANWNEIESPLDSWNLYIVGPSAYDGLRYRNQFSVMKKILYPNGNDAFYLVSYL